MNWDKDELAQKLQENPDFLKANMKIEKGKLYWMTEEGVLPRKVEPPQQSPEQARKGMKDRLGILLPKEHKYHAKKYEFNGKIYPSIKEGRFAQNLSLLQKAGDIDFYLEQVPFRLSNGSIYRLDFMTFKRKPKSWPGKEWNIHFIETKGFKTPLGEHKRKECEALYHIKIEVV